MVQTGQGVAATEGEELLAEEELVPGVGVAAVDEPAWPPPDVDSKDCVGIGVMIAPPPALPPTAAEAAVGLVDTPPLPADAGALVGAADAPDVAPLLDAPAAPVVSAAAGVPVPATIGAVTG